MYWVGLNGYLFIALPESTFRFSLRNEEGKIRNIGLKSALIAVRDSGQTLDTRYWLN